MHCLEQKMLFTSICFVSPTRCTSAKQHSKDGSVNVPSPLDFGWLLVEGQLKPRYMTKPHCPPGLSAKSSCRCVKGRCSKSCSCEDAGPCTVACLCGGHPDRCDRAKQAELLQDVDSSESESSDSE